MSEKYDKFSEHKFNKQISKKIKDKVYTNKYARIKQMKIENSKSLTNQKNKNNNL
jgi:hypothetical protein